MFWAILHWLSFTAPNRPTSKRAPPWTAHPQRPPEADVSCYEHINGTWLCAEDWMLLKTVHREDSY